MSVTASSSNPYDVLNGNMSTNSGSGSKVDPNSAQGIQDRFLKLLTTQLQAQDPSNPMDNSQITSQMAQISQVTGMQNLNSTMQTLLQSQISSQSLLAAGMVGRKAMVVGNTVESDGTGTTPMQGGVALADKAGQVTVTVTNEAGAVVDSFSLPDPQAGVNTFSWDGKDAQGKALPAGKYSFSAEATTHTDSGSTQVKSAILVNRGINGVTWDNSGNPLLVLSDGSRVNLSQVVQFA